MAKKQIILYVVAALFALSGIMGLTEGNFSGCLGCLVIAAICVFFARKKENTKNAATKRTADKGAAAEVIRTKLVGVTFDNEDGQNRQEILAGMTGAEEVTVEQYTYEGQPAACVKWNNNVLGNLSADLAKDLKAKYPNARYTAEILEITGGGNGCSYGCNIELTITEEHKEKQQVPREIMVFVDASSKKYHSKPNCSGMKNAKSIPLSKAKKKYAACKKCCK